MHGVLRVPRHGQSRHFDAQKCQPCPRQICQLCPRSIHCCKESRQRNSYPQPEHFIPAAAQKMSRGPAIASALTKLAQLGSRTHCGVPPFNELVQPYQVPARFAADESIGFASAFVFRCFPLHALRQRVALCRNLQGLNQRASRHRAADRVRSKPREFCGGTCYWRTTRHVLCRGRYEVLRLGIAVSLPTFFAAAKKVGAAPHRGNANRPARNQDSTITSKKPKKFDIRHALCRSSPCPFVVG
ncbi:hypothetical protein AWB74_07477 [Caballeronia arvi]|uniref:Uncharacterized protein n=1 Tax=Caballeronia arvi TaxID=1777135 RepID=A0A158KYR4_9BURK|nr:hypothetical protein AWB74_07477 [Caballeronia arvi]